MKLIFILLHILLFSIFCCDAILSAKYETFKLIKNNKLIGFFPLDKNLSDISPFRLDVNFEKQREKYRKRIRDARIKAKLARYRAERLCAIYEDKFGYWPSEDEDEAQTEVESDNSY